MHWVRIREERRRCKVDRTVKEKLKTGCVIIDNMLASCADG